MSPSVHHILTYKKDFQLKTKHLLANTSRGAAFEVGAVGVNKFGPVWGQGWGCGGGGNSHLTYDMETPL